METLPQTKVASEPPLDIRAQLRGKNLVVVGGTGFLGKVWLALILSRAEELGHIYLVVRGKQGQSASGRLHSQILTSDVFRPLRERHGEGFTAFIEKKITPIDGDVTRSHCGVDPEWIQKLNGKIAAIVNIAGIVDFDPPLDKAFDVNVLGCRHLVELARSLGGCGLLHTSTCFTAGSRTGAIEELDPRKIPFPHAVRPEHKNNGCAAWDVEREIHGCQEVIAEARSQSAPSSASDALRRRKSQGSLSAIGMERAKRWGWPNTYTYTKSLGEQVVAGSGLPFTIVRPAIVESTLAFPFPGWNEGINTSSPFIYLIRQGGLQIPGSTNNLDLIPCDLVGIAITLALVELIEGRAKPVYQAAASDLNPCTMERFFELSGLHKRRLYRRGEQKPSVSFWIQKHFESVLVSKRGYESYGPRTLARGAEQVSGLVKRLGRGPFTSVVLSAARSLDQFATQQKKMARVMDTFLPFVAEYQYVFRTDSVRHAFARLSPAEKELFPWRPESIDWRHWFLEIHAPALERYVFPELDAKMRRPKRSTSSAPAARPSV